MLVHVPVDERGFAARRHPCRLPRINQLISGGPSSHDIVYRAAAPLLQSHHITHSENTMNPTTMKPATVTTPSKVPQQAASPGPKAKSAPGSSCTSPDHQAIHRLQIAECAYFIAESRNFAGGDQIQDWLTAEQSVCCPVR